MSWKRASCSATTIPHRLQTPETKSPAASWYGPSDTKRSVTRTVLPVPCFTPVRLSRNRPHRSGQDLSQRCGNLFIVGMPSRLCFRVDESIVEHDFKSSAARRDEDEAIDDPLEFLEQLLRRAHGTVAIASNDAVFDTQFHVDERSRVSRGRPERPRTFRRNRPTHPHRCRCMSS